MINQWVFFMGITVLHYTEINGLSEWLFANWWYLPSMDQPYRVIAIEADAGGMGIPASSISVWYRSISIPDRDPEPD